MSKIWLKGIQVQNYRSFGETQSVVFPSKDFKKPVAIVGYNNAGKTNLLNAILYGITEKYVTKNTFTRDDFHNRMIENVPSIITGIKSSAETKFDGKTANLSGYHTLEITLDGQEIENARMESYHTKDFLDANRNFQAFGASKYYKIFYINFHEIKKEISTKKTSWGNLTSFLAKHIKSLVDADVEMNKKKDSFKEEVKIATENILAESKLNDFIEKIRVNYSKNLRNDLCNIDFGLPDYEDIFLEMVFKVGLNGDAENLIPIEHFGDGYISMFVMAVIQAIAETNQDEECLFLFEEPESFLHENHQEYFYNMVLCDLARNNHQVIYTTHSDKMVDIFDTKGLIRLEFDETEKQTKVKYNRAKDDLILGLSEGNIIEEIKDYNNYIKTIEPNLNKIIFSRKVVLVEGPNDMMVYKELIRKEVLKKTKDQQFANSYLNFKNFVIIPHHGKITASILMKLCCHLGIDYFVISDFDFDEDFIEKLDFKTEEEYERSSFYKEEIEHIKARNSKGEEHSLKTKRAMITTNWRLLNESIKDQIHFNIPRLEELIRYEKYDKSSLGVWDSINRMTEVNPKLFPEKLKDFLEINQLG